MIEIKNLNEHHIEEILAVWRGSGLSIRPQGRDAIPELEKQMRFEGSIFLGAFEGKELIGVALLNHEGRKGWVNRLAVLPAYRRRGIASRLVEAGETALRQAGMKVICTLVEDWNENSLKFMQKLGYQLHKDIFYLSKRDAPED